MATITCYGGVGEIGGNKLLVEIDATAVFLDFGYGFGAESQFYEEFLQPRSNTKLGDLLDLGLTPRLDGIYREDALRPVDLERLDGNESAPLWGTEVQSYEEASEKGDWTPDALFLSHAHLDHAGYVPFLGDVPMYCSPTTETVLEALVDLGNLAGFDAEFLELKRRLVDSFSGGYFPGAPKVDRAEATPRTVNRVTPSDSTPIGSLDLEVFDVGHSIPGALACLLEGADTQVVYTGDLRFHGRSGTDLGEALEGLRPDAMLCEGTRIDEDDPDDEQRVEDEMAEAIEATDGLAMVGFAWKDLERYETVRLAAERAGRTPVFDPRLAYLKARFGESVYDDGASVFLERSGSMLYSPGDYTRSKHKAGELEYDAWDSSDGIVDTRHLESGTTAVDVQEDPTEFVLQLDYFRFKNLPDIDPPLGSTFIRGQTEPFNDEMQISERRLVNWLSHYGVNDHLDGRPIQIHASGHASGSEIQRMIDRIQPRILVPVHTTEPGAFENPHGEVRPPTEGVGIDV